MFSIFGFGKKRKRKPIKSNKKGGPPKMSANKFNKTGHSVMKGTDGNYYTITPVGETHGPDVRWRWIKTKISRGEKVYNGFGKRSIKRSTKKIPMNIKKLARKYKIKLTIKRGNKRVYKSLSTIKKLIKRKMKKAKK